MHIYIDVNYKQQVSYVCLGVKVDLVGVGCLLLACLRHLQRRLSKRLPLCGLQGVFGLFSDAISIAILSINISVYVVSVWLRVYTLIQIRLLCIHRSILSNNLWLSNDVACHGCLLPAWWFENLLGIRLT